MTPKQKADELEKKMLDKCRVTLAGATSIFQKMAKGLAVICVEEILKICPVVDAFNPFKEEGDQKFVEYWNEVLNHLK